jgi:hypothetical protein
MLGAAAYTVPPLPTRLTLGAEPSTPNARGALRWLYVVPSSGGVGRHEVQCSLLTVVATLAFLVEPPRWLCACHDHRRCSLKSQHNHHSAYLNVVGGSIRVTPLRPVNSALIIMVGVPLCV